MALKMKYGLIHGLLVVFALIFFSFLQESISSDTRYILPLFVGMYVASAFRVGAISAIYSFIILFGFLILFNSLGIGSYIVKSDGALFDALRLGSYAFIIAFTIVINAVIMNIALRIRQIF